MKDAYYFSHDCNARNDEKILMLRAEHGWEGYGIYWALIEMMFESAETSLSHNKIKGIAVSYNIDITLLESVINTCIREGLFCSDNDTFWSESLRRRKNKYHEIKKKRSEAGKKGMAKRWGKNNTDITNDNNSYNNDITKNNKGKESKVKENKDIYSAFFEKVWSLYPNKVGKGKISDTKKKEIYKLGDEFERCISRYIKHVEERRNSGFKDLKYQNGSTFFNSGYVDYLDKNYQDKEEKQQPKQEFIPKFVFRDL